MPHPMLCPHCSEAQVFEAVRPIEVRPVVEAWRADSIDGQIPKDTLFVCLGCDEAVTVDVKNQLVRKASFPTPQWNETVARIVDQCRDRADSDVPVPDTVKSAAREAGYRHIHETITPRELMLTIIEQRP